MRYIIKLFVIILAFSLFNVQANATWCMKNSCIGMTGYILIQDTQFWTEIPKTVNIDGKEYLFDPQGNNLEYFHNFYKDAGLPPVGQVIKLNKENSIMDDDEINKELNKEKKYSYIKFYKEGYGIKTVGKQANKIADITLPNNLGDHLLNMGSEVKILDYRTITYEGINYLFAKVKVLYDFSFVRD